MSEQQPNSKNIPVKPIADLIDAAYYKGQHDMLNLWASQAITLSLIVARLNQAGLLPLEGLLADLDKQAAAAEKGSPEQVSFRELIVHIHACVARLAGNPMPYESGPEPDGH
ncbi:MULTISPECIES: hypothetical protein [Methylococcus]|uniref:Uncharacterized protein n=1 Tax=Methylococcus capsulatus TaxID=414 RepID=A0ABZ2F114_METCP|nr:hypothetical protein [Methylococcus sp. BF19-07]